MAYKHIEIIGSCNVPGRGLIFITLDRTTRPGEVVEVGGKIWKVTSVELSESQPQAGLVVTPFTESDAKRETANDAKKLLEALFSPMMEATPDLPVENNPAEEMVLHNPLAGMMAPTPPLPKPALPRFR